MFEISIQTKKILKNCNEFVQLHFKPIFEILDLTKTTSIDVAPTPSTNDFEKQPTTNAIT